MVTGNGLKDVATAARALATLAPVAPTIEAIAEKILNS